MTNNKKAIILNSGGFDSVVMIHSLMNTTDNEYTSLFFNYGQRNLERERDCAKGVADKFNLEHIEIEIPRLDWSKSTLCDTTVDKEFVEYLEMRNVIFLSYALSLAESKGATEIYSAILFGGTYTDTKKEFIEATSSYFKYFGIDFKTPFDNVDKEELGHLARAFDIKRNEFFSCNRPTQDNKECGECGDCLAIDDVYNNIITNDTPIKEWLQNGVSDRFKKLFMNSPIYEARLLINNKCQFDCKHCFYGFDETKVPDLSFEEMCGVIDQVAKLDGIQNIHFSGKEPLYNDLIFKYADYIRTNYPHLTYDVVTNGLSIPKYAKLIKEHGFKKVYLSVDDIVNETLTIRPIGDHIVKNIELLQEQGVDIEIFLDCHKGNYIHARSIIEYLHHVIGVNTFFVRTVAPIGKGRTFDKVLNVEELEKLYELLKGIDSKKDLSITFYTHSGFTKAVIDADHDSELLKDLYLVADTSYPYINSHLKLFTEFYCSPCEDQITITSDGYLLGCATEVSSKNYDKISGGNVREYDLPKLIEAKRKMSLSILDKQRGDNIRPCFHTFYKIN